ncbi:MAG: lipase family protein [Mycobacteriaceae bacterium]
MISKGFGASLGKNLLCTCFVALTVNIGPSAAEPTVVSSEIPSVSLVTFLPTNALPGQLLDVSSAKAVATIPGTSMALRISYVTTGVDGQFATSTGSVFLPEGSPPPGGWPVLSWAHGTVGVADSCAPSVTGPAYPERDFSYLRFWLDNGYAVVASDYVGLGTEGIHPYGNGPITGFSVVDIVRAARKSVPTLSANWAVIGHSQGGQAALFTAQVAPHYAPELNFLGAVATGASAYWSTAAPLAGPWLPAIPIEGAVSYISLLLAGLEASYPHIDINHYLTEIGRETVDLAQNLCVDELDKATSEIALGDMFSTSLNTPELVNAITAMQTIPTSGYSTPIRIAAGITDLTTPLPIAATLAADLLTHGTEITFYTYPGGHGQVMAQSQEDSLVFLTSLFP